MTRQLPAFCAVALILAIGGCNCDRGGTHPNEAALLVKPTRVDFRPTLLGGERESVLTLQNQAQLDVQVNLELPDDGPFAVSGETHVVTGGSSTLHVKFRPTSVGHFESVLTIRSDAEPLQVLLSGEGLTCTADACHTATWDDASATCVGGTEADGTFCKTACLIGGHCREGVCEGFATNCDDLNACTSDTCDESSGCIHSDVSAECPEPSGPCRAAFCDPRVGCGTAIAPDGTACEDGCIVGQCSSGVCMGHAGSCDDGNPCTVDSCSGDGGCIHEDGTSLCPVSGCEVPTCDPVAGCGTKPAPDGSLCGGQGCAGLYVCVAGSCVRQEADGGICGCNDSEPSETFAAGGLHACRITPTKTVECWGSNRFGQLGDGTFTDRLVSTPVVGLGDVVQISTGGYYTCARTTAGDVYCWGLNDYGEVGPTRATKQHLPYLVPDVTNATSVSAGDHSTCATTIDGSVWCWGWDTQPQGAPAPRTSPKKIIGITDAVSVEANEGQACALLKDRTVRCWGGGGSGLGVGTAPGAFFTPRIALTPDGELRNIAQLEPFEGSNGRCARSIFGEIFCMRIGGDPDPIATDPVPDGGSWFAKLNLPCASQLSTGGGVGGCVTLADSTVRCWSYHNESGQLGTGDTLVPPGYVSNVSGLSGVREIHASMGAFACAVLEDGGYTCWGSNDAGQFGDGTTQSKLAP